MGTLCAGQTTGRLVLPGQPTTWSSKLNDKSERRAAMVASLRALGHYEANVAVAAVFYRATRHRIDVDNMLKDLLDAGTDAGCWKDDQQVSAVFGVIEMDTVGPRTVVYAGQHQSTMNRRPGPTPKPCEQCGEPFADPRLAARFCSRRCVSRHLAGGNDLSIPVPCPQCGTLFRRRYSGSVVCGSACRTAAMIGRNQAKGQPPRRCHCGATLSKPTYKQCRACWRGRPAADTLAYSRLAPTRGAPPL